MKDKMRIVWYIIFILILIMSVINRCMYIDKKETEHKHTNDTVIENTEKVEIESKEGDDTNRTIEPVSLGTFKITGYCSCKICCNSWSNNRPKDKYGNDIVVGAIGEELKAGYSIAVDPETIPYNSKVMINGHIYEAQDCGGAIKGNRIDIYFSSHQEAINHGVQYAEVFILPN